MNEGKTVAVDCLPYQNFKEVIIMAVRKKSNTVEPTVEVVEEQNVEVTEPVQVNPEVVEEKVEVETPATDKVEIDTESLNVDESKIPEMDDKNVRIRMRTDHHCVIAMQRYDLKAGQCYNVPTNVKDILNRAGLLAPL